MAAPRSGTWLALLLAVAHLVWSPLRELHDQPLLAGSFDVLFRAPDRAFIAGDTVDQCGGTIRVTDVEHGLPSRLAITYQRRLDDPKLTFLVWRDHDLARIALPAIGESVELPGP